MHERILMGGAGGQGIVSLGKLVARLGANSVGYVTFFPAYGAEVRGGTSNCQVILSDEEIAAPLAETFDSLLLFNQQSVDQFLPYLEGQGVAIINQSISRAAPDPRIIMVPATEWADALGDARVVNFVMLGAWLARKPLWPESAVAQMLATHFPGAAPALIDINLKALRRGLAVAGPSA